MKLGTDIVSLLENLEDDQVDEAIIFLRNEKKLRKELFIEKLMVNDRVSFECKGNGAFVIGDIVKKTKTILYVYDDVHDRTFKVSPRKVKLERRACV